MPVDLLRILRFISILAKSTVRIGPENRIRPTGRVRDFGLRLLKQHKETKLPISLATRDESHEMSAGGWRW
jgi:hypothetical protein